MKFTVSLLIFLISELVSVGAGALSSSLNRRNGADFEDDDVLDLTVREDFDYDQAANLFARSMFSKRNGPIKSTQKPGSTKAVPNTRAAVLSKPGPLHDNRVETVTKKKTSKGCLRVRSDGTLVRRMMCEGGSDEPSGGGHNNPSGNEAHGSNQPPTPRVVVSQQSKNRQQQKKNTAQQQNNLAQHGHNQAQAQHNIGQLSSNTQQGKSNTDQQGKNEKQQDSNAAQRLDNSEQKNHNKEQAQANVHQDASNKAQFDHNGHQAGANTRQFDHNIMQERLNTGQQTANLRQDASNEAQKTSNTKQQADNAATMHAIQKSKPSTLDKCLDFASGACTVAAGAVTLEGVRRIQTNPDDPSGNQLALAGGAATVAAGAFTLMKDPLKKCIGAACWAGKAGYNYLRGNNQAQAPAQNPGHQTPPPSPRDPALNVRSLIRRALLTEKLASRGLPAHEIVRRVDHDSRVLLAADLMKRSSMAGGYSDAFDDLIWG